jgi:natural product biosynthesis luciferase-like monooxygenase protein
MLSAIRNLWDTGVHHAVNGVGQPVALQLHPQPVRQPLPAWLTVSRSAEGYAMAAREGLNVLTHMETQDMATLAERIDTYRAERARWGHDPDAGVVTVMQHTLIAGDEDRLIEFADRRLEDYLRSAADLERQSVERGGAMSGGRDAHLEQSLIVDRSVRDEMVEYARERLRRGASLVGTFEECEAQVARLADVGVDEIACLIDFVGDTKTMSASLDGVERLNARFSAEGRQRQRRQAVAAFLDLDSTAEAP